MILLVYSTEDSASVNIAEQIKKRHGLKDTESISDHLPELVLYKITTPLVHAEFLDEIGADLIILLCRHTSASEVPAMTVHSAGNWGSEARLGGKPRSLSVAAPSAMLSILERMRKSESKVEKTYEATHHGPLLNTPSVFAELGGTETTMTDPEFGAVVGDAVYGAATDVINLNLHYKKIVMGIGGNHYPKRFTKLAVEKGYAFSHIMSKYSIINDNGDSIDMLEQAVARSSERPELAVIDWKSLKAEVREHVIGKLGMIGIDYERI